jgi:hypothetical protein
MQTTRNHTPTHFLTLPTELKFEILRHELRFDHRRISPLSHEIRFKHEHLPPIALTSRALKDLAYKT